VHIYIFPVYHRVVISRKHKSYKQVLRQVQNVSKIICLSSVKYIGVTAHSTHAVHNVLYVYKLRVCYEIHLSFIIVNIYIIMIIKTHSCYVPCTQIVRSA
jgi:hypothetical protein